MAINTAPTTNMRTNQVGGFDQPFTPKDGSHMWFRTPSGEIVCHTAAKFDLVDRQEEGWEPLKRYGLFKYLVYHAAHPYETLFMRGGAKEFSVKQIMENGWHLNPPLIPTCGIPVGTQGHGGDPRKSHHTAECLEGAQPVHFPQLDGLELPGQQVCPYCERSDLPTPQALKNHVGVMHKDMLGHEYQAEALLKGLREERREGRQHEATGPDDLFAAFQRWLAEQPSAPAPAHREPDAFDVSRRYGDVELRPVTVARGAIDVEWEPAPPETLPTAPSFAYVCGFCGEGFNNSRLFLGHVKKCKAGPAEALAVPDDVEDNVDDDR